MAEHDDALLDDDFASLPDISDEEYELDFNNDDTTISTQESISDQLRQSSLEDILELTDLDACEEYEKELIEPESNCLHTENVKQEDINIIYSNGNKLRNQFNDEDTLSIDDTGSPENNCISESRFKTVRQYEPNVQDENFCVNNSEYERQSTEKECGSHDFDRVSNENHSYIQSSNELSGPSVYQPCYNFQDQRINLDLNTSFLNEPPVHESYSIDHLGNQTVFWYNPNYCANYGYHPTMPRCLFQSSYQNSPFANQVLPVPQTFQMLHASHVPMMTNTSQPFLIDSDRQMLYNQNISPNYLDPIKSDQPAYENQDQSQFVLNPLYKQDHSNKRKVLINRHFSQTEVRRKNLLNDELYKTDLFLKKIALKEMNNQHWKKSSRSTNDPYSYFSDIWQTKEDAHEPSSLKRPLSPKILSKTSILQHQRLESKKNEHYQQDRKRMKHSNITKSCSIKTKDSNIRKTNMKLRKNCERKRKYNVQEAESILDTNIFKSKEKQKEIINVNIIKYFDIDKEEKMDPELVEYCRKIEEQKRQRDEFLQRKEARRKLLAMEKIGIKNEPSTDELL